MPSEGVWALLPSLALPELMQMLLPWMIQAPRCMDVPACGVLSCVKGRCTGAPAFHGAAADVVIDATMLSPGCMGVPACGDVHLEWVCGFSHLSPC